MNKNTQPKIYNWEILKRPLLAASSLVLLVMFALLLAGDWATLIDEWVRYIGLLALTFFLGFFSLLVIVYVDRRISKKQEDENAPSEETKKPE